MFPRATVQLKFCRLPVNRDAEFFFVRKIWKEKRVLSGYRVTGALSGYR